jgi:hypothetical protein
MADREEYIPSARDAVVAYFGRNARGNLRCYCVRCNDTDPLTDAHKVYGDCSAPEPTSLAVGHWGSDDTCEACEACGIALVALSKACQSEHDAQQARWARLPITHVVEMGMVGAVRCRIY